MHIGTAAFRHEKLIEAADPWIQYIILSSNLPAGNASVSMNDCQPPRFGLNMEKFLRWRANPSIC
jgi:hypothetical protein